MRPRELRHRRFAAHRAAHLAFAAPGLALRHDQALLGAALGLAGRASRPEIRRVARRASRRVLVYDRLWQDPALWPAFQIAGRHHLDAALARGRGVVLVPSHFGLYRWIAPTLLQLGLKVALLVDAPNRGHVEVDVAARMDRLFPALDWSVFTAVDSAAPAALWHLARALGQGRVALLFADGNSGEGGLAAERGAHRLTFLGQPIRVRPGIGALAAHTGAAIVPVFAQDRGPRPPILRFDPPVLPAPGEPARAFTARAMDHLFALLEREILAQPDRWEEWWVLPRWLDGPPRLPPPGPYDLSSESSLKGAPSDLSVGTDTIRRRRPAPAPPPPVLTLPALLGRRLRLLRPDAWVLNLRGSPELWLLGDGRVLPAAPPLPDLLLAAERRDLAAAWLRAQPHPDPARRALRLALDHALLALDR